MFTLTVHNSWFPGEEYGKLELARQQGFKP
jgi:hypothetical protein